MTDLWIYPRGLSADAPQRSSSSRPDGPATAAAQKGIDAGNCEPHSQEISASQLGWWMEIITLNKFISLSIPKRVYNQPAA